MNKSEIIKVIAYLNVPNGAQSVDKNDGKSGKKADRLGSGNGGLQAMAAKIFLEQLTTDTEDLSDIPTSVLFERLHRASLLFHQSLVVGTVFEEIKQHAINEHRNVVERLRLISRTHKIDYKGPDDDLLE